jgi:hypothetical protein
MPNSSPPAIAKNRKSPRRVNTGPPFPIHTNPGKTWLSSCTDCPTDDRCLPWMVSLRVPPNTCMLPPWNPPAACEAAEPTLPPLAGIYPPSGALTNSLAVPKRSDGFFAMDFWIALAAPFGRSDTLKKSIPRYLIFLHSATLQLVHSPVRVSSMESAVRLNTN